MKFVDNWPVVQIEGTHWKREKKADVEQREQVIRDKDPIAVVPGVTTTC